MSQVIVAERLKMPANELDVYLLPEDHPDVEADVQKWSGKEYTASWN